MRRIAIVVTTFALTMSGLAFSPAQANGDSYFPCVDDGNILGSGGFEVAEDENQQNFVINGSSCTGKAVIPNNVDYIAIDAFSSSSITNVEIPASVTLIGDYAFNYSALETVTIATGSDALVIGERAFANAYSLNSITIPARVTSIGEGAFQRSQLTSIDIPDTSLLETIGDYAFQRTQLTSIDIPAKVIYIGNSAFANAPLDKVTNPVTIADGPDLLSIGPYAFRSTELNSIVIPARVVVIDEGAFQSTEFLTSVTFDEALTPSSLIVIGDNAFSNATQLTSITIPASVTDIGKGAFENTQSLSEIVLDPAGSLYMIDSYAFYGSAITSITIPASLQVISNYAFLNTYALERFSVSGGNKFTVSEDVLFGQLGTELVAYPASRTVPLLDDEGQPVLDEGQPVEVFATTYTIPENVTWIREGAFAGNQGLQEFLVDAGNLNFSSPTTGADAGVLFYTTESRTTLVAYPAGRTVPGVDEEENPIEVTATSYSVPETVSYIEEFAFSNTYSLEIIEFDPDAILETIDDYAFAQSSIKNIIIPSSVTSIREGAFQATPLSTVTFEGSVSTPSSLLSIGNYAFSGSNSLTSITIPSSVESIGNGAFEYCSLLSTINISSGDSPLTIGNYAFTGANSLASITIPARVTRIGDGAFAIWEPENSKLKTVNLAASGSLTYIGDSAFSGARVLTSINIPSSVTFIGNYVLEFSRSLTSITIPENVNSIGRDALYGIEGLDTITFEGDINGGFNNDNGETLNNGTVSLPQYRTGHTFDGWYSDLSDTTTLVSEPYGYSVGDPVTFPVTLYSKFTADNPPAPDDSAARAAAAAAAADLAARTVKANKKFAAKTLAKKVGITIISKKAKVTFKVDRSSRRICTKSGSKLKTLKAGDCVVTFTVQEPKPKKGKKPKATKTKKTLVVVK